jgi:indole-3-glycerol phosphate synthase
MILDEIVVKRQIQLEKEIAAISREEMKRSAMAACATPTRGFAKALKGEGLAIIAEVKKASPSKGLIQPDFRPAQTAVAYEENGASAISVLTEEAYFLGSSDDLKAVRQVVELPILRKDFIFDDYQIYEARVIGADAVLLIAAVLDDDALKSFMALAASLDLDALVEVHDEVEMSRAVTCGARLIGINNRNLKTFEVDLKTTEKLIPMVPEDAICVSESGVSSAADIRTLAAWGADAVLVGETLMRSKDTGNTLQTLKQANRS